VAYASSNAFFGLAVEVSRGASVAPSSYVPIEGPKWTSKLTWLKDTGLRGSPVAVYDEVPGVRHDEFTFKSFIYGDTFPHFLRGVLGSTDTVAAAGGGASTHTIGLYNVASVGSQPPSYTLSSFDAWKCRQLTAAQLSEVNLTFGAEAAADVSLTYLSNPEVDAPIPVNTYSGEHLVPGWDVAASISGTSLAVVSMGELSIKRSVVPIHTEGMQSPYRLWAGECDVAGKLTFVVESTDQTLVYGLARNQLQVVIQLIDPVSTNVAQFQMSACQFEDPQIEQSKSYLEVSTNFIAVANPTDAISTYGGYSPIKTVTTNNVSTPF
jgi:hypothetical protein